MKTMMPMLISCLLLCGCSQKWAKSTTPAIDRVQTGTDISWHGGVVLHVEKRSGNSVEGVRVTSAALDGRKTAVRSTNGVLLPGAIENPTNRRFVRLRLRDAQFQAATQNGAAGEFTLVLSK